MTNKPLIALLLCCTVLMQAPLAAAFDWRKLNPYRVPAASETLNDEAIPTLNAEVEAAHWKALNVQLENLNIDEAALELTELSWVTPELRAHIQKALAHNQSIDIAKTQLEQAQAMRRMEFAKELPQVSLEPAISRIKLSQNQFIFGQNFGDLPEYFSYNLPLVASYEVDIWRINRDTTRAADRLIEAQGLQLEALREQLIAEVAVTYLNLLETEAMLKLQDERIALFQADVNRQQKWVNAGVADIQSLKEKEAALKTAQQERLQFTQKAQLLENSLQVLQGNAPTLAAPIEVETPLNELKPSLNLKAGLPSALVESRPDLQAARKLLEQQEIQYSVARRLILPRIRLQGDIGFLAVHLNDWLKWESLAYTLTAGLIQPLFTGGNIRAGIRLKEAELMNSLQQYHANIVRAFDDVESSLVLLNVAAEETVKLEAIAEATETRLEKERLKADVGLIHPVELTPLKLEANAVAMANTRNRGQRLVQEVSLLKALGRCRYIL